MNIAAARWRRWGVVALAAVIALAAAAYVAMHILTPAHPSAKELSVAMRTQSELTGPAKVYAATCAHCHDRAIGPVLSGRGIAPEAVTLIVRRGVGAMPAFRPSQIDDAQLGELAAYVSKLPANPGK